MLGCQALRSLGLRGGLSIVTALTLAACTTDFSTISTTCGDGVRDGTELCDGDDLGGDSCADRGYWNGFLTCLPTCDALDESTCHDYCGDGLVTSPEWCDGTNLAEQTCQTLGYQSGPLFCYPDCLSFDVSACLN